MKPKAERFEVLLKLAEHYRDVDVLNRYAVDKYIDQTGASFYVMPFGADKCPRMGADLGEMMRAGLFTRSACGISGLSGQGFPRWVWSYRLTPLGLQKLEEIKERRGNE